MSDKFHDNLHNLSNMGIASRNHINLGAEDFTWEMTWNDIAHRLDVDGPTPGKPLTRLALSSFFLASVRTSSLRLQPIYRCRNSDTSDTKMHESKRTLLRLTSARDVHVEGAALYCKLYMQILRPYPLGCDLTNQTNRHSIGPAFCA
jgi:hypothetical protein